MPPLAISIRKLARHGVALGLDLLYPPRCTFCDADLGGRAVAAICDECAARMAHDGPICRRCGSPVHEEIDLIDCPRCPGSHLSFDFATALGSYRDQLASAVLRTKHPSQFALAEALGRCLAFAREEPLTNFAPDVIVPVPMHWWNRMRRGVNGPELVADGLGRHFGRQVELVLRRRRLGQPQRSLPRNRRPANVRGAFAVRRGYLLDGARVLLVDDVMTTGATCSEAARMLRKAGAAAVGVAVVARAE